MPIRAVLFDVDGTLYQQPPMRALMSLELSSLLTSPARFPGRLRALAAYRKAQEALRASWEGRHDSLGSAQLEMASQKADVPRDEVERLVESWIHFRPLKYLRFCRAKGLTPLLDHLERSNVRMGVLSDYPAAKKLEALGIRERFSPVLCATDPEINAFKPHPKGFLRACELWRLKPAEVLMVGDRADADAAGAAAAGLPCVIIGRPPRTGQNFLTLSSLERLHRVLDPRA